MQFNRELMRGCAKGKTRGGTKPDSEEGSQWTVVAGGLAEAAGIGVSQPSAVMRENDATLILDSRPSILLTQRRRDAES